MFIFVKIIKMKGIYLIENRTTEEKYIGSAYKIHGRWGAHIRDLLAKKYPNESLQKWFDGGSGISDMQFSILHYYLEPVSDKELLEKETELSLKYNSINRLPLEKDGKSNFSHKRSTIIKLLKTQGRYNGIVYAINRKYEILGQFDIVQDAKKMFEVTTAAISRSIKNKSFVKHRDIGFITKSNYDKGVKLGEYEVYNKGKNMPFTGKKRSVVVYTVYGDYIKTFDDLYQCGKHFSTDAPNIHRKMNVLNPKKILIDSDLSKHILTDEGVDISEYKNYWVDKFSKISQSSGNLDIYTCFGEKIGTTNCSDFSAIMDIGERSLYNAIYRGTHIRSLKITKNGDGRQKNNSGGY